MKLLYIINLILAISSGVVMTISPFLLVEGLGVSMFIFSIIESSSELLAMVLRSFSGVIFDKLRDKKKIFLISTSMSLVAKLLLLSPTAIYVVLSKLFDRISNGLFSAPRDVFTLNNSAKRGLSFAILTASKSIGLIAAPFFISYMFIDSEAILLSIDGIVYFLITTILIALFCCLFIKDKSGVVNNNKKLINIDEFKQVIVTNKRFLITFSLFFLARFSDGLIALNMKQNGVPAYIYLSTIGIFNILMLFASFFYARLIDSGKINIAINLTILSLILFNILTLLLSVCPIYVSVLSLIFWGAQRIGSQVVFINAISKNLVEKKIAYLQGSAIGIEALLTGGTYFVGSLLAGFCASYGNQYMFMYSLLIATITLVYFNVTKRDV